MGNCGGLVLGRWTLTVVCTLLVMTVGVASAQDEPGGSGSDLQVASQNPIANLISVPFQHNIFGGVGPFDDPQYVFNIQPVVPFSLGDRWNLIVRPIIPFISNPMLFAGGGNETGLGNITLQTFLSPQAPLRTGLGDITWGAGPVVTFPTRTGVFLGSRNYAAGPAFVTFIVKNPWTYGFLAFNQWSFAGPEGEPDINQLTVQPFLNYNLPRGWSIGTAPVISVDWEKAGDNVTLPLGGGVTKLTRFGKQPISISAKGYYNVLSPEQGADWQAQLQFTLLFPK